MKKLLVIVFLFLLINTLAQKQANIWYFGRNAGLDFSTNPPTALTNGSLSTLEGCSTFSDKNGNLLFYSDGTTVWDKNHTIMKYSDGRLGNTLRGDPSSTQSGMIIPKPKSDTIFYLFTVDDGPNGPGLPAFGLSLYIIDISKNGGNGEITNGPVSLSSGLEDRWTEKVAAVRGKECDTFWVISAVDNQFHAFKIDDKGVSTTPVVSTVDNFATRRGYLKLSPDGTKLAIANQLGNAMLYNFDASNGKVENSATVLISLADGNPYGVEFSVDSRKLYISTVSGFRATLTDPPTNYNLFQFDLNASDIRGSQSLIHRESPGFRGALQLAPDSKIYVTIPLAYTDPSGDATFLDVIENPNAEAKDVIFTKDAIDLQGKLSTQGLPPFISSLLLPIEIIDSSSGEIINNQDKKYCIGESIEISSGSVTGTGITYEWSFDNGTTTNVLSKSSTLKINNLTSSNNGTYLLTVKLINDCGDVIVLEGDFNLDVFTPAIANTPPDINFCDLDGDGFNTFNFQVDVTPIILGTQNLSSFEVQYFTDKIDANNNNTVNALPVPYTNSTPFVNQTIYARVNNIQAPNACYEITEFNLMITEEPSPNQPTDYEACDDITNGGDTDGFFNNYILASKDAEILGTLATTQYKVSYHTTLTGAQTDSFTDSIDKNIPYRNNTINEQTIYVRVENTTNTNCVTISEPSSVHFKPFKLIVNPFPIIANNPAEIIQCDINRDLNTSINLTQAQVSISSNHLNETFKYYRNEADANSDTREIANPINYPTSNGDAVWVRTISSKNCFRVSKLNIGVSFTPNIVYNKEFTACDDFLDIDGNNTINNDDKDGISNFDLSEAVKEIKELFPISVRNNLEVLLFENENDRDIVTNSITNVSIYRNTNIPANTSQKIYVKIINKLNNNCTGLSEFSIRVNPLPDFEITSPQIVCLNIPSFIEAELPNGNYNYEWRKNGNTNIIGTNQQLNITNGGNYEVTAINTITNCSRSKTITINESVIATINQEDITIIDDSENNKILINNNNNNLGVGDYEFSLQDENNRTIRNFQDEPLFENLQGGIYTILVRDKNNCGVAKLDVSVLEFPKFFTPNGDGINDTWNIKGANTNFYPKSSISIFDRYGKIIASIQIDGEGWNGLYNGKVLPSTDYWFKITLTDLNGIIINRQGNFSLLRK